MLAIAMAAKFSHVQAFKNNGYVSSMALARLIGQAGRAFRHRDRYVLLPVDTLDSRWRHTRDLFGARPIWAAATNRRNDTNNKAPEYYFNPAAFTQATVIPSVHDPMALVGDLATDIGKYGTQRASWVKSAPWGALFATESKDLQFRADFFNLLNHANQDFHQRH